MCILDLHSSMPQSYHTGRSQHTAADSTHHGRGACLERADVAHAGVGESCLPHTHLTRAGC